MSLSELYSAMVEQQADRLAADRKRRQANRVAITVEAVKPLFYDIGIEFTEISKRDQEHLRENLQRLIEKGVPLSKPYI